MFGFLKIIIIVFQGNVTFSCSEPQTVPITFVNSRSSYLLLPGTPQIDGLSVSFQFRTWNEDGLLLSTELSEGSGTLLLILEGGTLRLLIKNVAGHGTESLTGTEFVDFFCNHHPLSSLHFSSPLLSSPCPIPSSSPLPFLLHFPILFSFPLFINVTSPKPTMVKFLPKTYQIIHRDEGWASARKCKFL